MDSSCGWQAMSTEAVPAEDRLDYWRDATNSLFPPTRVRRPTYAGFYGRLAWLNIGDVMLADIVSTSLEVTRSEREINGGDDRWFEVNIQVDGEGTFSQEGREVVTGPRSLVLYDSRKPYAMRFEGPYRQMSLKVLRGALCERVPNAGAMVARGILADTVPGRFLYDLAFGLCGAPEAISAPVAVRLEEHLLDLLATALLGTAETVSPHSVGRHLQLDRVKAYIGAHLGEADLSPLRVATAQRISLRYLYELFEGEDVAVSRWIQQQRLGRVRRDLADPLQRALPINTIAFRAGFKDISHFSRVFHRQFGVSPRDFRRSVSH
jgi:AraC-like DNA-binding protein